MPFDAYHPWVEGGQATGRLPALQLRARLEVMRAASTGVRVGFLYEDCFAHYSRWEETARNALGGMILADLGLTSSPLKAPVDRFDILAPSFSCYLRRFGIAESYLLSGDSPALLRPLCRTPARELTGVSIREGKGSILFLPGDPRRHFLDFFTTLGEGIRRFGTGTSASDRFLFAAESRLLEKRRKASRCVSRIDRRLDMFRRCRTLLFLAASDLDRLLPEWFLMFLGVELRASGEPGFFDLVAGSGGAARPSAFLGATTGSAGDGLVALQEIRQDRIRQGTLPSGIPGILYLAAERGGGTGTVAGLPDLQHEAHVESIRILRPEDLFRLLDDQDGKLGTGRERQDVIRSMLPEPAR
ncbi:MAG: hypothetical protein ACE5HD_01400 [Acidobacteriota bacterium]